MVTQPARIQNLRNFPFPVLFHLLVVHKSSLSRILNKFKNFALDLFEKGLLLSFRGTSFELLFPWKAYEHILLSNKPKCNQSFKVYCSLNMQLMLFGKKNISYPGSLSTESHQTICSDYIQTIYQTI